MSQQTPDPSADATADPVADPTHPPSLGRRLLRIAAELAFFAGLLLVVMGIMSRLRAPELPTQAPAFELPDLDGRPVQLAAYAGRAVVLNFWATWCMPCRIEAPALDAFARANPDIAVLGLAADGTPAELRAAAAELGIGYPILRADRATLAAYGVGMYPTTVFIDGAGRVVESHAGLMLRPHLWWAARGLAGR